MNYSLSILNNGREIHEINDNIDVEIRLEDGQVFSATLFSLECISDTMTNYQDSGECLNGKYFWASDMVIVKDLKLETINDIVKDLVESGEYKYACSKIS